MLYKIDTFFLINYNHNELVHLSFLIISLLVTSFVIPPHIIRRHVITPSHLLSFISHHLCHHITSSHHRITSSHHHITPPHHITTPPHHIITSPHHIITPPHHTTTSHHHIITTPPACARGVLFVLSVCWVPASALTALWTVWMREVMDAIKRRDVK